MLLKLLQAYALQPTLQRAMKIRAYDRKHPMAACLLSKADQDLLADAIHHANNPGR